MRGLHRVRRTIVRDVALGEETTMPDDEVNVFEFERRADRAAVAAFLRGLADGIERGHVDLRHDGETLVVEPPDDLDLDVEVELEDDGEDGLEGTIEIEISWRERAGTDPADR
jgi:amphi-Trp domain-containing protein